MPAGSRRKSGLAYLCCFTLTQQKWLFDLSAERIQSSSTSFTEAKRITAAMEAEPNFIVRQATQQDVPGINAILTYYALNTVMTFITSEQPDSVIAAKLDNIILENHLPFYVATARPPSLSSAARDVERNASHKVIGICYVSPYRAERLAYDHTGEISLFVHHEYHSQGTGSALLGAVLEEARKTRVKEILAVMAVDETGKGKGLALRDWYQRWRFREVGTLEKVGFKFDRW